MLAEKKRKTKWVLNPTKKPIWTTNSDGIKFGKELMEKMGWSAGKGLGANEQGIQEPLRVSYKNDTKGVGFRGNDDQWIEHQDEFNVLLNQLRNKSSVTNISEEDSNEIRSSLEEKSKRSRARVHYQKFTRGKDLSRYSENDLACILGTGKLSKKKPSNEEEIQTKSENDSNFETSFGVTTINSGSINDYFKKKQMLIKKSSEGATETDNSIKECIPLGKSDCSESLIYKDKTQPDEKLEESEESEFKKCQKGKKNKTKDETKSRKIKKTSHEYTDKDEPLENNENERENSLIGTKYNLDLVKKSCTRDEIEVTKDGEKSEHFVKKKRKPSSHVRSHEDEPFQNDENEINDKQENPPIEDENNFSLSKKKFKSKNNEAEIFEEKNYEEPIKKKRKKRSHDYTEKYEFVQNTNNQSDEGEKDLSMDNESNFNLSEKKSDHVVKKKKKKSSHANMDEDEPVQSYFQKLNDKEEDLVVENENYNFNSIKKRCKAKSDKTEICENRESCDFIKKKRKKNSHEFIDNDKFLRSTKSLLGEQESSLIENENNFNSVKKKSKTKRNSSSEAVEKSERFEEKQIKKNNRVKCEDQSFEKNENQLYDEEIYSTKENENNCDSHKKKSKSHKSRIPEEEKIEEQFIKKKKRSSHKDIDRDELLQSTEDLMDDKRKNSLIRDKNNFSSAKERGKSKSDEAEIEEDKSNYEDYNKKNRKKSSHECFDKGDLQRDQNKLNDKQRLLVENENVVNSDKRMSKSDKTEFSKDEEEVDHIIENKRKKLLKYNEKFHKRDSFLKPNNKIIKTQCRNASDFYPGLSGNERVEKLLAWVNFSEFKGSNLGSVTGYGRLLKCENAPK